MRTKEENFKDVLDIYKNDTSKKDFKLLSIGGRPYVQFTCCICEGNGVDSNGMGFGVFKARLDSAIKRLACCCRRKFMLEKERRKYHLTETLSKEVELVEWLDDKYNTKSLIKIRCKEHGEVIQRYNTIAKSGSCKHCAKYGYKTSIKGFFYIMFLKSNSENHVGFGVTNNLKTRFSKHRSNFKKVGINVEDCYLFETDGKSALELENCFKNYLDTCGIDVEGFKSECLQLKYKSTIIKVLELMVESNLQKFDTNFFEKVDMANVENYEAVLKISLVPTLSNTTGVRGLSYRLINGYYYWNASFRHKDKNYKKTFSVLKFGYEESKRMACEYLEAARKEVTRN